MKEFLYVALALALIWAPPLRRAFGALERSQQIALALLFLLVFGGQMHGEEEETYPFVRWAMYRKDPQRVVYTEYRGTRPDGVQELLPLADFVRVTDKRYAFRLRSLETRMDRAKTDAARAEAWDLYVRALQGGIASYRRRHPESRWTTIEASRCETDVPRYERGEEPECRTLWQLPAG